MTISRVDQLFAAFLIVLGAYIIYAGTGYGYMTGFTPGAGFFPIVIGTALIILSAVNLLRSLAGVERLAPGFSGRDVLRMGAIAVAIVVFVGLAPMIGITYAGMLLMLVIGLAIKPSREPAFLIRLVAASILVPLFCRVAFGNWLNIPMPKGPFGI